MDCCVDRFVDVNVNVGSIGGALIVVVVIKDDDDDDDVDDDDDGINANPLHRSAKHSIDIAAIFLCCPIFILDVCSLMEEYICVYVYLCMYHKARIIFNIQ